MGPSSPKRGHSIPQFSDPAPIPQEGAHQPQFSAHVCCGQTAGWIKMPLSTDHIVLYGDPATPKTGHSSPQFSAHVRCGQRVGLIKMSLGTNVGLGPGDIVLDGDPSSQNGTAAPTFLPMSIVAKILWSPISATAELLSSLLYLFFFVSVQQTTLAIRQLLGTRKYSLSYRIVSYWIVKGCADFIS